MNTRFVPFSGTSNTLRGETSRSETIQETPGLLQRLLSRNRNSDTTLDELIDIENNTEIFSREQLRNLRARTLYNIGPLTRGAKLYQTRRERTLALQDNQQELIPLIDQDAYRQINQEYPLMHLGALIIGVRGLVRKESGTKVLLVILDTRFSELDQQMVGTMEVDLNNNSAIIYLCPDYFMTVQDFKKHMKILVQVKGFGNFTGCNVLLDIHFLGKVMKKHDVNMRLKINNIVEVLTSKAIRFLPPEKISLEKLAGLDWNIQNPNQEVETIAPTEAHVYTQGRNLSLRFSSYKLTNLGNLDQEEEESQTTTSS